MYGNTWKITLKPYQSLYSNEMHEKNSDNSSGPSLNYKPPSPNKTMHPPLTHVTTSTKS